MMTKQNDAVAMTEQQLDAVAGGAPHYTDLGGRFHNPIYENVDKGYVIKLASWRYAPHL